MGYLPVSIDLEGKRVSVIGGGAVATARVDALLEAGARVTVISPEPSPRIARLASSGEVTLIERAYRCGDLDGARLVMAATDDPIVNASVWREAQKIRTLVNVADDPERCDFIMPAIVRRGALSIAVSTSGKSPALAVRLRQKIAAMVGPEYEKLLALLDRARAVLRNTSPDPEIRRRVQYRLVDSDLLNLVRHGNERAIERRMEELLEEPSPPESHERRGIVYIVGAGPGDPGLITLRGLECLRSADVVLHDRLIGKELLEEAHSGAEVIDVGKRAGDRGRMQEFIEKTMILRARQGDIVCRLKGGDPFVFGRGGEEARSLTAASVAYEIVPGVTSATAAPAAAGIPVTHREVAHSFLVMTGSRAEKAGPREWEGAAELLNVGGTLVVMMGLSHFRLIVARLQEAGCRDDMPVAVISRGTLPDQEVRTSTLGRAASIEVLASPGIIVFGHVVEERNKLAALGARSARSS